MTVEQDMVNGKQEKKFIDSIFWGGSLLWAGLVFGLDTFGYLPQIGDASSWSWVFLGMGLYGLLINFVRLLSTTLSNASSWDWLWAVVFMAIGAAGFVSVSVPWWLFLILIGIVIIINSIRGRE